jgi:hemin uptake protein HemP
MHDESSADTPEPVQRDASKSTREVRLEDLLGGGRELIIRHGEELYRLRVTRNGRLLLTK